MKRPILLSLVLLFAYGGTSAQNQRQSRDELLRLIEGKQFTLRVPYSSNSIMLSEDGSCLKNCERGGWARDALVTGRTLSINGSVASIEGDRYVVYYNSQNKPQGLHTGSIQIKVKLGTAVTEPTLAAALSHIFMEPSDRTPIGPPPDPTGEVAQYEIKVGRGEILAREKSGQEWKSVTSSQAAMEVGSLVDGEKVYLATQALADLRGIRLPAPISPKAQQLRGRSGSVVLLIVVDSSGYVQSIKVVNADDPGFAESAAFAVANWQYSPATLKEKPVAFEMSVAVDFH